MQQYDINLLFDTMFDFPFYDEMLKGLLLRLKQDTSDENIQIVKTYLNDTLDIPQTVKHHINIRLELLKDVVVI